MTTRALVLFIVIFSAAAAGLAGGGAQTARMPAMPAMSDDVLSELRMLRTEVNRGMAAHLRAQVLATRVQLQALARQHPTDHDRWTYFDARLNELETALAGPQP